MEDSGGIAKRTSVLVVLIVIEIIALMALVGTTCVIAVNREKDITEEVNISRNIYNVSMQDAEQYLRKENIDYAKHDGQLEVKKVSFVIKNNILVIDSDKGGTSYCVDVILNANLSDESYSVKNNEVNYYLENKSIRITEKDGELKYYRIIRAAFLYIFSFFFGMVDVLGIIVGIDMIKDIRRSE